MVSLVGLSAIVTAATLVWIVSVRLRDASIADVCWGLGFALLTWLDCLLSPALTTRSWLVATLITLWGARLSLHILRRNRGKGEDPRYQVTRLPRRRLLVAQLVHCLLASGHDPLVRRHPGSSRWAPHAPPLSRCSMDSAYCSSRQDSASRWWETISSSASELSHGIAATCSTADCGAIRGIRTTSETLCCVGLVTPWPQQRRGDGSPCRVQPSWHCC